DLFEAGLGEADAAQRRISDINASVADLSQHHEMFETGVFDGHDAWMLEAFQVLELGAEAAALITQRRSEAFHVQQRETPSLGDLLRLAEVEKPLHDLALVQIQ